jgi:hypothetical protein
MIPVFFSSARMILLECHESPARVGRDLRVVFEMGQSWGTNANWPRVQDNTRAEHSCD